MPASLCPHGGALRSCPRCLADAAATFGPLLAATRPDRPPFGAPTVPPGVPGGAFVPARAAPPRRLIREALALLSDADETYLAPYVKGAFVPADAAPGEQERWVPPMQAASQAITRAIRLLERCP